jgi:hypothetical protein
MGGEGMRHAHSLRLGTILAVSAAIALVLGTAASAGLIFQDTFHDEGTFVLEDFCDVPGLTIDGAFTVDGRVQATPHGPSGLAYFIEHLRSTTVLTNPETGLSTTEVVTVLQKDQRVIDNGDGTLTILELGTGNDVVYGPAGKAIARNPGQIRFELLIDDSGTPTDPSDDVFLADLGTVKDSTGRNDDFCEAVVPALT